MRTWMSLLLITVLAAAGVPAAASVSGVPLASEWLPGDDCGQVLAWGDRMVANTGAALAVFDPTTATGTAQVRAEVLFVWMAVDGERLYAVDGMLPAMLRVYRRDGDALLEEHAWPLPSWSPFLHAKDLRDGLFVMPSGSDLVLWDVSGDALVELGRVATGSSTVVTTRNRVAYAASVVEGSLSGLLVDARGPGTPIPITWAADLVPPLGIAGDRLLGRDGMDLVVLDLAGPLQPAEVGRFDATGMNGFCADGASLLLGTATGWRVLDLTDPLAPQPGTDVALDLPWTYGVHGLCRLGDVVATAEVRGLSFHAAADPAAPTLIARFPTTHRLSGLESRHGSILLRGEAAGVSFLDPGTAAVAPAPFLTPDSASRIASYGPWLGYTLGGDLTFLSDDGSGGLAVHGVRSGLPGGPAAAADGVLYIAEPSLLRATDAADPVTPDFEMTSETGIMEPLAMVHAAGTLAVAGSDRLTFYRTAPDKSLVELQTLAVVGVSDLAVMDEMLYVASTLAPLSVFRLSDTEMPAFQGAGAAPTATCLAVGDGVLLAGHEDGVSVLDITAPAAPVWTAALDLGYAVLDLAVDGTTVIALEETTHVGRAWTYPNLLDGIVANEPDPGQVPSPAPKLILAAAPNPFNPSLRLALELPAPGPATLEILDLRGRRVVELQHGPLAAGRHEFRWDGRDDAGQDLPSGTYVARLRQADAVRSVKLTLAR